MPGGWHNIVHLTNCLSFESAWRSLMLLHGRLLTVGFYKLEWEGLKEMENKG